MKKSFNLLRILFLLFSLYGIPGAYAQYTKLFDFKGASNGKSPYCDVISDGTFLYATTYYGGVNNYGTIFKIKPDGSSYSKLLDFAGANGEYAQCTLYYDGTYLYGTTSSGGASGYGVIFKIKPDGTGYTKLLDFTNVNGGMPVGALISDGTFLYGMTFQGGANNYGIIYKIKPDGTGFLNLLDFAGASNGSNPDGAFIYDGTFLYGTTGTGGANFKGTVFKIKTDGSGFVKLFDFAGAANGSLPYSTLYSDGTYLYGMTNQGGANNFGNIFKIKTDGTGFSSLLDFAGATNGSYPHGSLISDGTFLYGMTYQGGAKNNGTIFQIKPDGSGYNKLLDFSDTATGSGPTGSLYLIGSTLYGMTPFGDTAKMGTLFSYSMAPLRVAENSEMRSSCKIYPNPASDVLFIQSTEKIKTLQCFNSLGQAIAIEFENNSIKVAAFPAGIYCLSITTDNGNTLRKKFIKQ